MAGGTCWRCLCRLQRPLSASSALRPPLTRHASLPFSTSTSVNAAGGGVSVSKPRVMGPPKRNQKALNLKTKRREKGRPPAPGERRALKNRVVLSNTNAFEVAGLPSLTLRTISDPESVGRIMAVPGEIVDHLRAIDSFKPSQRWHYYRRPAVLIRKEFLDIAKQIDAMDTAEEKQTLRTIVVGPKGAGKSVFLLQAQAAAFLKGWIVMHIPNAQDLTIAHTAYNPIPKTDPVKYAQKNYTSQFLSQIIRANLGILSKLNVTLDHPSVPTKLQPDMTLDRLAELGVGNAEIAWPVFRALWAEMTAKPSDPAQQRPPLLFTLDGLAHISRLSEYIAPNMYNIHAHDLALVDLFLQFFRGTEPQTLPNGGAFMAADSCSNRPQAPSLDLAVRQNEELQARSNPALPPPDDSTETASPVASARPELPLHDAQNPHATHDIRVLSALQHVPVTRLHGCSRDETRALLEYYAKSGMLPNTVSEALVSEAWTSCGGGILGEVETSAVVQGALGLSAIVNEHKTKARKI